MNKKLFVSLAAAAFLAGCSGSGDDKKTDEEKPEEAAVEKPEEAAAPASDNKFAAEAAKNITEENAEAEADKLEKELMAELEG